MNSRAARASGAAERGPEERIPAWVWLAAGIALQLVANGRWIATPAAWVAPVGWLVFLERSSLRIGVPVAFLLFVGVELIAWRGLVPAPGALYYLIVGGYATVYFLPFLSHRLLVPRLSGIAATLVFPLGWVGFEYAFQRWGTPYGSWFSIAYTQIDVPPLAQVASFAGAAGISFLLTWFSSVVVRLLRPSSGTAVRGRIALTYGVAVAVCLAYGEIRLGQTSTGESTRVAGIVPSQEVTANLEREITEVLSGGRPSEERISKIDRTARRLNDDLFSRTVREARSGARIVAWSETAGRVLDSGEAGFLERARQVATEEGIDLFLAYGVWTPGASPPFQNKVVAVTAGGGVEWQYEKARPIVGPESPFVRAGDGVVRALRSPRGRTAAVICHDLDFPDLVRQAHHLRAELVIGPSDDWAAITPLHANMARLRAIEFGFALFRPTSSGRSLAVDSRGRVLMAVDYAKDAVVAQVPFAAGQTVYGTLGDAFAWLCLAGWVLATGVAVRRPVADLRGEDPSPASPRVRTDGRASAPHTSTGSGST